jgi:hypothetical protein
MITTLLRKVSRRVWRTLNPPRLPPAALEEQRRDRLGLGQQDIDPERALDEAVAWLGRAQDHSLVVDGGVAHHYSLINGWSTSYPETTGYIVPTMLDYARFRGGPQAQDARWRARRMLDWLVAIQFPEGGFQGGLVDATPRVPVTFNTGQILLGLAAGVQEFGDPYREPMSRAADWLVATQDSDGCWRKFPTPFADPGEKAYETHVSWGLFEAARVGSPRYAEAGIANVRWALRQQRDNGWFEQCSLGLSDEPITHTLGYVLRGILEAYRYSKEPSLLAAARKTADALVQALRPNGYLPGAFHADWSPAASWVCLTGTVQLASCWLLLFHETGEVRYRDAGLAANAYVRRTLNLDGPPEVRGGVKGSLPVDGSYGPYRYLNWACKFFVDAHLLELALRRG